MPNILCIESSYNICSVAVFNKNTLFSKESASFQNHAEDISRLILNCLEDCQIRMNELDAVAISDGPGSYTGLRIGASTAKGICFASNIPLIKINTLKSLAAAFMKKNPEYKGLIWPMIDARRMEVYHCIYNHHLIAQTEITSGIVSDDSFQSIVPDNEIIICGNGAEKAVEILNLPKIDNILPHALHLLDLAFIKFMNNRFVDIDSYQPFYLKNANITNSSK